MTFQAVDHDGDLYASDTTDLLADAVPWMSLSYGLSLDKTVSADWIGHEDDRHIKGNIIVRHEDMAGAVKFKHLRIQGITKSSFMRLWRLIENER